MARKTLIKQVITRYLSLVFVGSSSLSFGFTLEDAINQTLQSHPQLMAIKHEREARTYEVKGARSGYLPQLSVDAGIGYENRRAPTTGDEAVELRRRELGLQARQMLFNGFATSSEVARQKARLTSIEFEEKTERERVALRTIDVYLNVLRHAELLELARASLWEHQNIYDQMKLRSQNGVGSKADLDQISARLALANANTLVSQTNLADAQTSFYRVVGVYPSMDSMVVPEPIAGLPDSREAALEMALENHPVLLGAKADVRAADSQYAAAKSPYLPRLSLEADKRWDDNIGGIEGEDDDLVIALRVKYDLFKGGENKARRKQTSYLREAAKDIRNNSRRQIVENLHLAWNSYNALVQQTPFLESHVSAVTSTKTAYSKQFNIGRRTLLDLLNTETELVDAKRALVNAKYDQLFARSRVLNAIGKLLDTVGTSKS